MTQAVFLNSNPDPKLTDKNGEFRQSIPFPLNGRMVTGVGSDNRMNNYVGGILQPINYTNQFDPINAQEGVLSNYIGVSSFGNEVTLPIQLERPCYCIPAGPTYGPSLIPAFSESIPGTSKQYSVVWGPQSPYNASYAESMELVTLFGITRLPNYNGYMGFAVYSDSKLRDPGIVNKLGRVKDLTTTDNNLESVINCMCEYGAYFYNNRDLKFCDLIASPSYGCCIYIRIVILDNQMNFKQILDYDTNFFDATDYNSTEPKSSIEIPRKFMLYGCDVDDAAAKFKACSNSLTSFDYRWNKNFKGIVLELSPNSVKEMKEKIKNGASEKNIVQEQIIKLCSDVPGSVVLNYGSIQFKFPEDYDSDKPTDPIILAKREYLEWIFSGENYAEIMHAGFYLGSFKINLGFTFRNGEFFTNNIPYLPIKTGEFGMVNWCYPLASAPELYGDGRMIPFNYNYGSTTSKNNLIFGGGRQDNGSSKLSQFLFNGASYILTPEGELQMTLPGAAPTNPLIDDSFTSQGGNWLDMSTVYTGRLDYLANLSMFPMKYPFVGYKKHDGDIFEKHANYFGEGKHRMVWVGLGLVGVPSTSYFMSLTGGLVFF